MKNILLAMALAGCIGAAAQDLSHYELIAHYPLEMSSADLTGNNDTITLINAPYVTGKGVYSNGNYIFGDPDSCLIQTPELDSLDLTGFAIQLDFMVEEHVGPPNYVMVGGEFWRWFGLSLWSSDSSFRLIGGGVAQDHAGTYELNTWYRATLVYDSVDQEGTFYVDGVMMDQQSFDLQHGSDRDISNTHFGSGLTFKGFWKDLKVYNRGADCVSYDVTITPDQTQTISAGDSVVFTAIKNQPGGAKIIWYQDGVMIPNEHDSTYAAKDPGTYYTKIIHNNGCEDSSVAVMVDVLTGVEALRDIEMTVRPNPATRSIHLTTSEEFDFMFLTLSGQAVRVGERRSGTHVLDVSELPRGAYLLTVSSNSGVRTVNILLQ